MRFSGCLVLLLVLLPCASAQAGVALALENNGWVFALHGVLVLVALRRVWKSSDNGLVGKVAWSVVCTFGLIVGPILCIGLTNMPNFDLEKSRARSGTIYGAGIGRAGSEGIPVIYNWLTGYEDPRIEHVPQGIGPHADCLKHAQAGDAQAQAHYGMALEYGDGMTQDFVQAAAWYRRAAEQEFAPAQAQLAELYARGHGVAQSLEESCFWLSLAAKQDPRYRDRLDEHMMNIDRRQKSSVEQRLANWKKLPESLPAMS